MSYILEALKKSDHQRAGRAGGFAQLSSYVFIDDQGEGRRGLILLAFVMLLTGVAIGWWRFGVAGGKVTLALPPVVPLAAVRATDVADVPRGPAASLGVASAKAAPAAPTTVAPTRSDSVTPKPPRSLTVSAPMPPATPIRATDPTPERKSERRSLATAGTGQTLMPSAPPSAERSAEGRVVDLADLPSDVRSQLPRLVVTGFAGADDAQSRFAVVNEQIVREGEEIAHGVTLDSVVDDGVVLAYRGYRFRPMP